MFYNVLDASSLALNLFFFFSRCWIIDQNVFEMIEKTYVISVRMFENIS